MWDTIIAAALKIIDKVIPDPAQKAAAQLQVLQLQQAGEFKKLESDTAIALAQADINKVEAGSNSAFKSGWRPGAGWVCVIGLAYSLIALPVLTWVCRLKAWPVPPEIDANQVMALLVPMLGLGAYRTYEKKAGVA